MNSSQLSVPDDTEFHMVSKRELLSVLFERKLAVTLVFSFVYGLILLFAFYLVSPNYEAKSKILINLNDITGELLSSGQYVSDFEKLANFHTQKDIFESSFLVEKVVDNLNLPEIRVIGRFEKIQIGLLEFKQVLGDLLGIEKWIKPIDMRARSIAAVSRGLEIETSPESTAVKFAYRAKNAEEAAHTLNGLVNAYTNYHYDQIEQRAESLIEYLQGQVENIEQNLEHIETDILNFKKGGLETVEELSKGEEGSALFRITDTENVQLELKAYIMEMEETLRNLREIYAENNIRIVGLREKIALYVDKMNSIPDYSLGLSRKKRELTLNQEMYLLMKKNLEQVKIVAGGQTEKTNQIIVLEEAEPNESPVSPSRKLLVAFGAVLGLGMAIVWAFFLNYVDHTIGSVADVRRYLGLRTIGSITKLSRLA